MTSLADQIVNGYALSVFDTMERSFLPDCCIVKFVTEASIIRELDDEDAIPKNEEEELVNFILQYAKRVFATALVSGVEGNGLRVALRKFKDNNFQDKCLPVSKDDLSPVFSKTKFKIDLEPGHILPFTWIDEETKEGTFSEVFQVKIHESHQADPILTVEGNRANVAIKKIKDIKHTKKVGSNHELQEKVNKEWEAEAKALDEISGLNHPNIIQRIAAITRGRERYFMFQWADGGSLREFWESLPHPSLDQDFVREIVQQLRGLADALNELHNYKGSYRHGDLKPENILRFKDLTRIGILKIADMGLAKHHTVATHLRPPTSTRYGTVRYEPPEVMTHNLADEGRSRLYDIWSMGCITLELIVWLLYGYDELKEFNESIKGSLQEPSPYFEVKSENGIQVAKVHRNVRYCIDHISKDPESSGTTAMRDLLEIVKTNLLVVSLPQPISSSLGLDEEDSRVAVTYADGIDQPANSSRATAKALRDLLDGMIGKGEKNRNYWFTGNKRDGLRRLRPVPVISTHNDFLSPNLAQRQKPVIDNSRTESPAEPSTQLAPSQMQNLNNLWEFPVDNNFSRDLLDDIKTSVGMIQYPRTTQLCGRCQNLDFRAPRFQMQDLLSELKEKSRACDFCKMRWDVCKDLNQEEFLSVQFDRLESTLRMNERYPPIFSIFQSSNMDEIAPKAPNEMAPIQIGFPKLPEVGSDMHLKILRKWLKNCDDKHPRCRPSDTTNLPTRLVDVGDADSILIKLYETRPNDSIKYIALSHPWGDPPHFCTFTSNIEEHKQKIEFEKLPSTFQHAVTITRKLGFRYIWIDSVCIIQGHDGDFNTEAKRMEDVFSSAYCVLAASSAKGQNEGFLKERDEREYLTCGRDGVSPFYICQFVDNFNQHVLEGSLNKRGWVLQERALARRTIYFTSKQTYWECGGGVRCETLTKMDNKLASFIGDPRFPEVAMQSSRGGKIRLYQDLYRQYSRLNFTHICDRPIAIAGLEKRLNQAFRTNGGFGVFDDKLSLLHRSLLWHRGSDENSLDKIVFPVDWQTMVPTWSWMAYKGGIDYLDLPFDGVDWEEDEVRSYWTPGSHGVCHVENQAGVVELSAVPRGFNIKGLTGKGSKIIYDIPAKTDDLSQNIKCVVVGRLKAAGQPKQNRIHYVLFVAPKAAQGTSGGQLWERVGVGYMLGQWIKTGQPGTLEKIC